MTDTRIRNLLEVYDLDEILELIGLEPYDLLVILSDFGYLDNLETPEPL